MKRSNLMKLFAIMLVAVMALSLFACADDETVTTTEAPGEDTTESTTTGETTTVTTEATTEATTESASVEEVTIDVLPDTTGCGGTVSIIGLALVSAIASCAVLVSKKKEDK